MVSYTVGSESSIWAMCVAGQCSGPVYCCVGKSLSGQTLGLEGQGLPGGEAEVSTDGYTGEDQTN